MAVMSATAAMAALLLASMLALPSGVISAAPKHRHLKGCWFNCNPQPPPTPTYPKLSSKAFKTNAVTPTTGTNTINGKVYITVTDAKTFSVLVQVVSAQVNGQSFSPATFVGTFGTTTSTGVDIEQSPLAWSSANEGTFAAAPGTYTIADVTTACFALQLTQATTTNTAIFNTC